MPAISRLSKINKTNPGDGFAILFLMAGRVIIILLNYSDLMADLQNGEGMKRHTTRKRNRRLKLEALLRRPWKWPSMVENPRFWSMVFQRNVEPPCIRVEPCSCGELRERNFLDATNMNFEPYIPYHIPLPKPDVLYYFWPETFTVKNYTTEEL